MKLSFEKDLTSRIDAWQKLMIKKCIPSVSKLDWGVTH